MSMETVEGRKEKYGVMLDDGRVQANDNLRCASPNDVIRDPQCSTFAWAVPGWRYDWMDHHIPHIF